MTSFNIDIDIAIDDVDVSLMLIRIINVDAIIFSNDVI